MHEKYNWGAPRGIFGQRFLELSQRYKILTGKDIACAFTGKDWIEFESHGDTLRLCQIVRDFSGADRVYAVADSIWLLNYRLQEAKEKGVKPPCNIGQEYINKIVSTKIGEESCRILEEHKSKSADQYRIYNYEALQEWAGHFGGNSACVLSKEELRKVKVEVITNSLCGLLARSERNGVSSILAEMDLRDLRALGQQTVLCDGRNIDALLEKPAVGTKSPGL